MARVLINFAHPALEKSRVHKQLLTTIKGIKGITINDLYEWYPDLDIDVAREQQLLEKHDIILLQHPFYWYSAPAIIKQWLDLVLEHGWAYGHTGKALQGKYFGNVISAGSAEKGYQPGGIHQYPVHQFLLPFSQTAALCNMHYSAPYVIYGVHRMDIEDIRTATQQYHHMLELLRDDKIDPAALTRLTYMNEALQLPSQTRSI
ncbi:NAD(P)H-dependent oxidoreductase [Chitinophaga varians]|uniref:NAD(P)H-dependent oxidoreductase n=1 Tax=Chitinophaga varians TaxID=2202339 RepID=UPI00165FC3B3|nr:NAD(P)H-dependent oxidoreductase [Chitinophaga varians]MBC9911162.1 NAD(P)H-dependent oxidoreductase [Chitinophaga varians]